MVRNGEKSRQAEKGRTGNIEGEKKDHYNGGEKFVLRGSISLIFITLFNDSLPVKKVILRRTRQNHRARPL